MDLFGVFGIAGALCLGIAFGAILAYVFAVIPARDAADFLAEQLVSTEEELHNLEHYTNDLILRHAHESTEKRDGVKEVAVEMTVEKLH